MEEHRETIWGILPRDRQWFQLLTLVGGIAGSVAATCLTLVYGSGSPDEVFRDILLGIGASFVAAGFFAWGILQFKELMMPIGDWIRQINERNRARLREEGKQEGRAEGYMMGYRDAQEGKPERPPAATNGKGPEVDDLRC